MRDSNQKILRRLFVATAIGALAAAGPGWAQHAPRQVYQLEPQSLADALRAVSRASGKEIMFPADAVKGHRAPVLSGSFTLEEAMHRLLDGTGLVAEFRDDIVLVRGRSQPSGESADHPAEGADIMVTGSRLRNAQLPSTRITLHRDEMEAAGKSTLSDVIQTIPQNFSGGQTPGLSLTLPTANGENIGSSAAINLRGLGQDATLTLVNGHRLAYGGYRQSVDVSSIPLVAVDRIDIVPDGASAIYGSDAVAGVANIVLRRSFTGLQTTATLGASTDGGNEQQLYSALAGTKWSGGDVSVGYEFGRSTAIDARERSYTARTNPGLTLYPELTHHNLLATAKQSIGSSLHLAIDVLANWRTSVAAYSLDGLPNSARYVLNNRHFAFSAAPSLTWEIGRRWTLAVVGTYGKDLVKSNTDAVLGSTSTPQVRSCFCNAAWSTEASFTATPFDLPGGALQLAGGAGIRSNTLEALRTVGGARNVRVSQDTRYGFGEVGIPLIGPDQNVPLLRRLIVSAAVRYEDYPGIDKVATPKVGVVAEILPGLDLKGSWGRSFKAPTLFQLYGDRNLSLRKATVAGGVGYPAAATILLESGGNTALTPEHASTWSISAVAQPTLVPGLRVEVSYFDVQYRDRIVTPIPFISQSLKNALYAGYVQLNPSAAQLAAALDGRNFTNLASAPYDPANIVAIVHSGNTNAAEQKAHGVDVLATYRRSLGTDASLRLDANVSYLELTQKLTPSQPTVNLAGTVFYPAHWRGRGGAIVRLGGTTIAGYVNYIGGVEDKRTSPFDAVRGMTTFDLSVSHEFRAGPSLVRGATVRLSAQNFLNAKPDPIQSSAVYDIAFDTTNYSALGRVASLTLSKRW